MDTRINRVDLKEKLRRQALLVGFDVAGFAPPNPPPNGHYLAEWLAAGRQGEMTWMARHVEQRQNPALMLDGVGSILVVGTNYRPPDNPLDSLQDPEAMSVAACARNRDYHLVLKKQLHQVHQWLEGEVGHPVPARMFVDTAPVMEKPLAVLAGLGWQGKNTLLVSRRFGCWLLLAELFLTLPLPPDEPERDHCGDCRRCQDACPTQALALPYRLDARQCLAYMTIEARGAFPERGRQVLGNRVYGCDNCVAVCPFNRFAPVTQKTDFLPRSELQEPKLADFVALEEGRFREIFRQSPIKRLGRERFLRNLDMALKNK
ncbi:MAG: tRNA epoxyqueuosine(34) reductase QueG [Magnetococcus sp. DMHC-1]